jgi:hypothetical protein
MPDADSAHIAALAPGIGTTLYPCSRTNFTSVRRARLVVLMHGYHFFSDRKMREQVACSASILGGDHVYGSEHIHCAKGDVAQIPYRGGYDI